MRPSLDGAPWDSGSAPAVGGSASVAPPMARGDDANGRRRAGTRPGCRIDRQAPARRGGARHGSRERRGAPVAGRRALGLRVGPDVGGIASVAPPMARGGERRVGAGPGFVPVAASTGRPPLAAASRATVRGSGAVRPSLDGVPWDSGSAPDVGGIASVASPMARGGERTVGAGPGFVPDAASTGRPPLAAASRAMVRGSGAARMSVDEALRDSGLAQDVVCTDSAVAPIAMR